MVGPRYPIANHSGALTSLSPNVRAMITPELIEGIFIETQIRLEIGVDDDDDATKQANFT